VSVLEKASDVIDCLGRAGEPVTLGYVRTTLGMPKSSVHWLLGELTRLGMVRRADDGRYSLGPRLLYWGEAAASTFDLRSIAEGPMRHLRDDVEESVHLYIRDGASRICIAAVEGRHELRPFVQLGRRLPLRVGAAGKLLLAFADSDLQEAELVQAAEGGSSVTDVAGAPLAAQLDRIRTDRWATSVGERERGVSAVATTIVDLGGRVVAALCISAPTTRLGPDRFEEMREPLVASAGEISARLTGAD
jgi:IclR family KDG regulon transcriptional repressor